MCKVHHSDSKHQSDRRPCAAFQLGYLSRIGDPDGHFSTPLESVLGHVMAAFADDLPAAIYVELQHLQAGFHGQIQLTPDIGDDPVVRYLVGGINTGATIERQGLIRRFRAIAEKVVPRESPYRSWYETGTVLGQFYCAVLARPAVADEGWGLQSLVQEMPEDVVERCPTLSWLRDCDPETALSQTTWVPTLAEMVRTALKATGHAVDQIPQVVGGVEAIHSLIRAVETAAMNAKWTNKSGSAPRIAPEHRTKPMSYREAARRLGKGNSQDAAEWVSKSVRDGTLRCEHISRQQHVFDKRQFPNETVR